MVSTPQQLAGIQDDRFDAVLIEIANSWMPAEQTILSLRELHPGLSDRILAFTSGITNPEMLELIERYGLRQISRETLLPQIWTALEEFVAGSPIAKLAPHSMEDAQLIFDSFRGPLPAGVRSSHEPGRHLAYRHKNEIVDLLITPEVGSGRVLLAGQVMSGGLGMANNNGLVVLLIDGIKTVARTTTNKFGEFQLESEIIEDPYLQIRLREGRWAAIALDKMDWAKKRLPD